MAETRLWAGPGVSLRDGAGVVEFALHPGGYVRFGDDVGARRGARAHRAARCRCS